MLNIINLNSIDLTGPATIANLLGAHCTIGERKMQSLKVRVKRNRNRIFRLDDAIWGLQKLKCPHPKEFHVDEIRRSYCSACDTTFWEISSGE